MEDDKEPNGCHYWNAVNVHFVILGESLKHGDELGVCNQGKVLAPLYAYHTLQWMLNSSEHCAREQA